jgi:competence protein ComEA
MTNLLVLGAAWLRSVVYRHTWQLGLVLAAFTVAAGVLVLWPRTPDPGTSAPTLSAQEVDSAQQRFVIVYVSGAVRNPGLYRLEARLRVVDAIVAAGGMTETADQTCLPNLAAHLKDAKQIDVPFAGRCKGATRKAKLDINTASRGQLLTVPGMDGALADAIIAFRDANGGFASLTELKSGLGLDKTLYQQLQKSLTVP